MQLDIVLTLSLCLVLPVCLIALGRFLHLRRSVREVMVGTDKVLYRISIPRANEKGPLSAEQLYASIHGILGSAKIANHLFSFEIVAGSYGIHFIVATDSKYAEFLANQIFAQYPEAEMARVGDYLADAPVQKYFKSVELSLKEKSFLPFKTFTNFTVDPLAAITAAVSKLKNEEEVFIQIVTRPVANSWQSLGKSYVDSRKTKTDSEGKKVALESGESEELREIERKNTKAGFQFVIRIMARANDMSRVEGYLNEVVASFNQFGTPHLNSLKVRKLDTSPMQQLGNLIFGKTLNRTLTAYGKFIQRFLDQKEPGIINIEELASLFHLPNKSVETPNISWSLSKKLEPPINLPDFKSGANLYGLTDFRGEAKYFGILPPDRRRHMYILGKTGSGKSNLMKNMILADIHMGKGVGVLDPHGDLIEDIMEKIPAERINDVVLFDPSDYDYPVGLNLLRLSNGFQRDVVADGILEVFKKQFGDSWGPRLQYILLNSILTLLDCENVSLMALTRLLVDTNYRTFLLKQVKDPILKQYWEGEYAQMAKNPKLLTEAISPIQNKVGRFISSPMIRNMIAQVKAPIKIDKIMNEGKILLVNLSQGKIGEENSALLGGLFVTKVFSSAMERAALSAEERRDFYLYVDEFQNFATKTFIKILSEARKYGLNLIIAHQYIDQIEPDVANAIFGNIGTMVTFTVGQQDAVKLEREYKPYLDFQDLVNLPKYSFVNKLMIDGTQTQPFTAKSFMAQFIGAQNGPELIRNYTREHYAAPRSEIEQKIQKWSNTKYDDKGKPII